MASLVVVEGDFSEYPALFPGAHISDILNIAHRPVGVSGLRLDTRALSLSGRKSFKNKHSATDYGLHFILQIHIHIYCLGSYCWSTRHQPPTVPLWFSQTGLTRFFVFHDYIKAPYRFSILDQTSPVNSPKNFLAFQSFRTTYLM